MQNCILNFKTSVAEINARLNCQISLKFNKKVKKNFYKSKWEIGYYYLGYYYLEYPILIKKLFGYL